MTRLTDTTAAAIAAEMVGARRRAGSPAMGMVMTLVVLATDELLDEALDAAKQASHEHPARVLAVSIGDGRGAPHVDADVFVGTEGWTGETALITLRGAVTKHAASVVLPLLLPDSPVVVWWAGSAPDSPADDPLGRLAKRRLTDAAAVSRGRRTAMRVQAEHYAPGNSDLAWTRITQWRGLLAAALDQHRGEVTSARVAGERISPSAELLAAWIELCLDVPVTRVASEGPGITSVSLETPDGPITIDRPDGVLATLSSPGQPDRPVALKRRPLPDLLAEELRHLDEDEVYADVARHLLRSS